MLTKIEKKGQQSYLTQFDGKPLWKWINDIIDAITDAGGGSVYNVADVAARDAISDPEEGAIAFILDADGSGNAGISGYDGSSWNTPYLVSAVGGTDTKLQGLSLAGTTLTATLSDASTVTVDLAGLPDQVNDVYNVADVAARDAIAAPVQGSIAFIADADGSGNAGISGYDGSAWNSPFVLTAGGGGGGTSYIVLDDVGTDFRVTVGYEGAVPTLTVNAAGDYTINRNGGTLISLDVFGTTNSLSGAGDLTVRAQTNQLYERRFAYGIFNPGNGAAVDAHAQGNNPTQNVNLGLVSLTFPNMQPYGATGFEISLR
jgi:hypothetical protein